MKQLKCILSILLCICLLAGCAQNAVNTDGSTASPLNSPEPSPTETTAPSTSTGQSENQNELANIKTQDILTFLTELEDRVTGSEANASACDYIAELYEKIGLLPYVKDGYPWEYTQQIDGESVSVNNVVGYFKGKDSKRAAVISCHLDAVAGSPGAVDNASGVAALLQTAAKLSADKNALETDVIFCAFNGEEQFFLGSIAFVEEFKGSYEQVYNINYDCVGATYGGDYMLGASSDEVGYKLNMAVRKVFDDCDIGYSEFPVSSVRSDHLSFHNAGIPNITLTQINVLSQNHSPQDTIDRLDKGLIDELSGVVADFIVSSKGEAYAP